MLGINMQNIDTAGGDRPGAGGYVIKITKVVNRPDKKYIEIEYDIDEGKFQGHYTDLYDRKGYWHGHGRFRKSTKDKALPYLKAFIELVQAENNGAPGLVVGDFENIDESKLPGCRLGVVYGMEEYIGNDGKVKQRPDFFNAEFVPIERIRNGEFEVPDLKPLENNPVQAGASVIDTTAGPVPGFGPISDDDIPLV